MKNALKQFKKYKHLVKNQDIMVYVDMTMPSYKQRLFVVDVKTGKILRDHHVAHGSKSNCKNNKAMACFFSNVIGSRKSSRGAMVTGKVYTWGKRFPTRNKLKLHGLIKGINDNVAKRAIVMHSSNYVTDSYIRRMGRAGNSWGCLAVDPAISDSLIDLIKDGTLVYVHA